MTYAELKQVKLSWDGSDAKALDLLLKSLPAMTLQEFQTCLSNRARSQGVPHGERPRVWLPYIAKYQQGPLNEFGKTEDGSGSCVKLFPRKADPTVENFMREREASNAR
jgi:hypothetical protein